MPLFARDSVVVACLVMKAGMLATEMTFGGFLILFLGTFLAVVSTLGRFLAIMSAMVVSSSSDSVSLPKASASALRFAESESVAAAAMSGGGDAGDFGSAIGEKPKLVGQYGDGDFGAAAAAMWRGGGDGDGDFGAAAAANLRGGGDGDGAYDDDAYDLVGS